MTAASTYTADTTTATSAGDPKIPADLLPVAKEWREKMVESAAEANETLMNKYLESGELTVEEIKAGLRERRA